MLRARSNESACRMSLGVQVAISILTIAGFACIVSAGGGESAADRSTSFRATWDWVQLSAKVSNGPANQENRLTLQGRIEVLDSNDLYGMYVSDPNICQAIDGSGNPIEWQPVPLRGVHSYQRLMYDNVAQPIDWDRLVDWDKLTDSIWARQIHPFDVSLQFLLDPNVPAPTSLSLLKWSVLGLYAERAIEVDVPFAPSAEWQEVAPGLRILVRYAGLQCDGMHHKYLTEVECMNGSLAGFNDELAVRAEMADYIVLESLLVDSQGKPLVETARFPPSVLWSESTESAGRGTVFCSAVLVGANYADVAGIRHIIAVHPVEVEIPFVWTDVPVPTVQAAH